MEIVVDLFSGLNTTKRPKQPEKSDEEICQRFGFVKDLETLSAQEDGRHHLFTVRTNSLKILSTYSKALPKHSRLYR